MRRVARSLLVVVSALIAAALTSAESSSAGTKAAWSLRSGPGRTHLVELYSSEGCSSCPPADAWLASLRSRADLWTTFVPIEFHVDYWNRLGWQDRYSRSTFTGRQRQYAEEWGSASVYTPGFVLNGKEWRPNKAPLGIRSTESGGTLQVQAEGEGGFHVSYRASDGKKRWTVVAALLGNGLESKVTSGENQGETLRHDFVVLNLKSAAMTGAAGLQEAHIDLPRPQHGQAKSYSLAVWVAEVGHLMPTQVVGGDLP